MRPVQRSCEVVAVRPAGAYHTLTVSAPEIAQGARPGQFVALAVGGPESGLLLRRAFSIHQARPDTGTVGIVFAVTGEGTRWLAGRRPGERVDVTGPLGTPFSLPAEPGAATLVGGGYGSAPLFGLALALRRRGGRPALILGAATADRVFGAAEAAGISAEVTVTTEDGSAGLPGRVTDALPAVLARTGSSTVYACGPMGMLRAVAAVAADHGAGCEVAVEESMACGIGVCMTCVLPVVGDDGATRMVRSCVEGPVFLGERVRWDDVGTVPPDAVGAITAPGAHR